MKLQILELSLIVESKKDKSSRGEVRIRTISDQVRTDDICFWPLAVVSVSSALDGRFSFRLVAPGSSPPQGFIIPVRKTLRRGENKIIAPEAFPVGHLDLPKGVWRLALDLAGVELREISFRIDRFRIGELVDKEGALRPGALDRITSGSPTLEELLDE